MIINIKPLHTALAILKKTAGSEMENPVVRMYSSKRILSISLNENYISTVIKLPALGQIEPCMTVLDPLYYFTKDVKTRAIEVLANEKLSINALATQETLLIPLKKIIPPENTINYVDTESISTSNLLYALERVTLPLEMEDVTAITGDSLSGYGQNIISSAKIPNLNINGILPYAPARRLVKLFKMFPQTIHYMPDIDNQMKFVAIRDPLEIEITVKTDPLKPSQLPVIPTPKPSFEVEISCLYHKLRRLSLITKGIPVKTVLEFDGLNLNVKVSNNYLSSTFSILTMPYCFGQGAIICNLRALLSFLSAVKAAKRVCFCICEKAWVLKTNLATLTITNGGN